MEILSNLKLKQWGLILFVLPLVVQLSFLYVLDKQLEQAEHERTEEGLAKQKQQHLSKILRAIIDSAVGGAIDAIPGRASAHDSRRGSIVVEEEFDQLEVLSKDNPDELAKIKVVRVQSEDIFQQMRDIKIKVDMHNLFQAVNQFKEMKPRISAIDSKISDLVRSQEAYEGMQNHNWSDERNQLKGAMIIGTCLNILMSAGLAIYFFRNTKRRLSIVIDNSYRLASNLPLHPPFTGTDEIAQLDKVFRAMAGSLDEMARKERAAVENALDVICSIDERGTLTNISAASLTVFGYGPDDLLGRNYKTIVLKEDLEESENNLRSIKEGSSIEPFVNRVQRSDGKIIDVLWSAHWSVEEKSFFCVAHDITERKRMEDMLREAEARIRLILQSMPIGLVIIDGSGRVEQNNPSLKRMFKRKDNLIGENLSKLIVKPETQTETEFAASLIEKAKTHAFETEGKRADGIPIPIEITINRFETLDGIRYLVLITDVTERHEVERLKQQFISMVSHELRSPLNSVLGFLDMLPVGIYGELNEKGQEKVGVAERSITRLIKLINDLLDLDRMESMALSMEVGQVKIQPVLERSVEAVKSLAEAQNIDLQVDTADATIVADGDRLVQVVVNLLSNAIKYSPQDGVVRIRIKTQGDWVEVRVTDQGRGIPEQYRARIFERFQQVTADDWRQKGGSGLGLPISKAIVTQLGGSIGVDSEEGKGSSFWFRLPAAKPSAEIAGPHTSEVLPS